MTPSVYKLPDMYRIDSKGKIRIRKSIVQAVKGGDAIWTVETGLKDGTLVKQELTYTEGKQGRNAFEQACFEANSKHESKQKKEKYVENIEDAVAGGEAELPVPMTAHKIEEAKNLEFPYYMQPKMDGNRCMIRITADNTITKWSREGNVFNNLEHLDKQLLKVAAEYYKVLGEDSPDLILDGELFTFEMPFKDVNGALKSPKKNLEELSGKELEKAEDQLRRRQLVQFWWFDLVNDKPFKEREKLIRTISKKLSIPLGTAESTISDGTVMGVLSALVTNKKEADAMHRSCVGEGFEGSMIRTQDNMYESKRSRSLFKRKDFFDAEYEIIRIDACDKYKDQGQYICTTKGGKEFGVTPKCSHVERRDLLKNAKKYLGKKLTVRYWDMFEDGTPRFGQGIRVREER